LHRERRVGAHSVLAHRRRQCVVYSRTATACHRRAADLADRQAITAAVGERRGLRDTRARLRPLGQPESAPARKPPPRGAERTAVKRTARQLLRAAGRGLFLPGPCGLARERSEDPARAARAEPCLKPAAGGLSWARR